MHGELIEGRYYEVIYVYENETSSVYVGVATSDTNIRSRWKNGALSTASGMIQDANSVREVSKHYYETGRDIAPNNNKEASVFLEK